MQKSIIVNDQYCPKNHHCPAVRFCPVGAIVQKDPFSAPTIDEDKCTNCGRCLHFCAFGVFEKRN